MHSDIIGETYGSYQEYLNDLEDALNEIIGIAYIPRDILELSAQNIDLFLESSI